MPVEATRQRFMDIGRKTFLAQGYAQASLRGMAKEAGLTLGAFYRYFPTKEALFEALVKAPAQEVLTRFETVQRDFQLMPVERQETELSGLTEDSFTDMIRIMCRQADAFKLIFCRSAGTRYEHYLDQLIAEEDAGTLAFVEALRQRHPQLEPIERPLVHILSSTLFQGIVQIFDHDMPEDEAMRCCARLREFYTAGWMRLLGLQ